MTFAKVLEILKPLRWQDLSTVQMGIRGILLSPPPQCGRHTRMAPGTDSGLPEKIYAACWIQNVLKISTQQEECT